MVCPRCQAEVEDPGDAPPEPTAAAMRPVGLDYLAPTQWCAGCERDYDAWSRRHATDVMWCALSGTIVVAAIALGIPLLGAPMLVATAGIFAGFATVFAVHRWNRRRRRAQFLRQGGLPRAYLT